MISYRASVKSKSLLQYFSNVKPTSVVSYHEHWGDGTAGDQCEALKKIYEEHPEGLTDREALVFMHYKGFMVDAGTIPARRHDLNKVWANIRDYSGTDLPSFLIVSNGRRENTTGKTAEVWQINPEFKR